MTIPGPFPTIPDHNTVRPADTSRLCFSQEYPVIYRNFSEIIFMTIPGYSWKFLTTTTVRPADTSRLCFSQECPVIYRNKLSKIDIYITHLIDISHLCRYSAIFLTINLFNSNMISNFATTLKNNLEHYEY